MGTNDIIEGGRVCYRPPGFDSAPTTAVEVLEQARAVLVEEGEDGKSRWETGHWFENHDPQKDPQDPYCNSWTVCAEGAVGIVTYGLDATGRNACPWEFKDNLATYNRLYSAANELLVEAANEMLRDTAECDCDYESGHEHDETECCDNCCEVNTTEHEEYCATISGSVAAVPDYNDSYCQTRDQAIAWFDKGIEIGRRRAA